MVFQWKISTDLQKAGKVVTFVRCVLLYKREKDCVMIDGEHRRRTKLLSNVSRGAVRLGDFFDVRPSKLALLVLFDELGLVG